MHRLLRMFFGISALVSLPLYAHQGPLDSEGCHPNPVHGSYHCHAGPMADRQFKSKQEMLRARQEKERDERSRARITRLTGRAPARP